ncbi:MAG: hypothetical protein CFH19_00107 [Alphaproteobacteria bacterium MarineAlpha5_Bin9]|nr:MAG: hypothetical protein CFH19_00107 [Alphaproteobacteria bacterium MarineAlpha5_Bin9]|tara:strand:- start:16059 stop:17636 length:1578 start_codon:yes stop_codon:yes gene_type:complete
MINKIFFILISLIINNRIFLSIKILRLKNSEYKYDFLNCFFENSEDLNRVFFSKKYLNTKSFNNESINYHSFSWLVSAKKLGGIQTVTNCKKHIFDWQNKKYNIFSFIWNEELISKRLINLIYNFDFYAISANSSEKKIIHKIISKHYYLLDLKISLKKNKDEISLETLKAILLFKLIHNLKISKIIKNILNNITTQINTEGFHKSINPSIQAEYINDLYEVKNILLFFNQNIPSQLENCITLMSSVLKNLFHKDNTIALFNGSNNSNIKNIIRINNSQKNLKTKNLSAVRSGLAVYSNKNLKIFFDITKPSSKILNKNLHAGTLSFELSYDSEKLITNCGSVEKRIGEKPEYLRYSAAHSTIILDNTNISELIKNKSYKRIPKKIFFDSLDNDKNIIWECSHDGYKKNYNSIIKRKLIISKKTPKIEGVDQIIPIIIKGKNTIYHIRFHLTPNCQCLLTNSKKSVIIKTKLKQSWIFNSESDLSLEESINITDGKRINKSLQIVIVGFVSNQKKIERWSLTKVK